MNRDNEIILKELEGVLDEKLDRIIDGIDRIGEGIDRVKSDMDNLERQQSMCVEKLGVFNVEYKG